MMALSPTRTAPQDENPRGSQAYSTFDQAVWDSALADAVRKKASSIHLISRNSVNSILFRRDGVLHSFEGLAPANFNSLTAHLKIAAGLQANRHLPQTGHFSASQAGRTYGIQVNSLPRERGDSLIAHINDQSAPPLALDELGFTQSDAWRHAIQSASGLCLIAGPTDSGKTTTLHATIRSMQALLRADSLVTCDELRNKDDVLGAIQSAKNGRLVIGTIHASSIFGAIEQLRSYGIADDVLRQQLRAVMAQQLARTVCSSCDATGCDDCANTGYNGRTMLSEVATFAHGAVRAAAWWSGARSLKDDALAKVEAGITDSREIERLYGRTTR